MIWFLHDTWSYKSVESPQSSSCNTFGLENVEYKVRSRAQVISKIHEGLVQYNLYIRFHNGAGLMDRVKPADVDSFCYVRRAMNFHDTIGVYFVNYERTFIRM